MVNVHKNTGISKIPTDWEIKKLNEIVSMKSGDAITSKSLSTSNQYPCFGGNGLRGYTAKYTHDGDFALIGRQGALCGNIQFLSGKFFASEHAVVVTPKSNIDIKWVYYLLMEMNLNQYSEISAQPGLSISKILNLSISLPTTKAEQSAIAKTLTDTDNLITQLERLLSKKKAIKQGAMQELLKPKDGWKEKKLGDIGECIIGLTYSPSDVSNTGKLVLRSSNIKGNKLVYDDNVIVNINIHDKLIAQKNDILICVRNGSRNLIGKCAIITGRAVGETFGAFMSIYRSPHNEYIFHVFQSNIIKRQIDEHIGATINQITNKSLNTFKIPFPTFEDQEQISKILSVMDSEIEALEIKHIKLRLIKQGMMQNLLTGKIRLA